MQNKLNLQVMPCRFLLPGYLQPYLDRFIKELYEKGYSKLTINGYYNSIAHFGTWLQKKSVSLEEIDYTVVEKFERHRCRCPGARRARRISHKYACRVKYFVSYLFKQEIITPKFQLMKKKTHPFLEEFKKSLISRGLSIKTIKTYEYSIQMLLPLLGRSPGKYNAKKIKQVICDVAKQKSRCQIKKLTTALKAYLRFLIIKKACHSDLDTAVPTVAEWKLSSLPKYITVNELKRVIASCDLHTKQGLRDRAIILLLSRLGLRAGDVINMQMDDIDWAEGTLRVKGKSRREVLLPLPQEVGNALLAYIKKARPLVAIEKLFLCLNAPYRPFPTSGGISSIVSAALSRAGIKHPPSCGAHLLRHTAATNMLRKGATLETISTVLRHRSLDMTAYYAKVDIPRLTQIAQSWPEGAPC